MLTQLKFTGKLNWNKLKFFEKILRLFIYFNDLQMQLDTDLVNLTGEVIKEV